MPNLRKTSSVLTYNDDEIFKAFENFTKICKTTNQSVKAKTFFKEDKNIPEVLYADDGRKFFPCYFCCRAFAFKNDQFTHMEQCTFRVTSNSERTLVQGKEKTQNTSSLQNRAFITKKVQNNSQPNTLTKQMRRLSNVTSKKLLVSKIQHAALKSHIIKAKHRKVQNNPVKPGTLVKMLPIKAQGNIALKPTALVRNKIQNGMSASNLTPKRAAITVQNRKLIPNIKQEINKSKLYKNLHLSGMYNNINTPKPKNKAIKVITKTINKNTSPLLQNSKMAELPVVQSPTKVQNKTAFPKIKLGLREELVETEFVDCTSQYSDNVCKSPERLSIHNREKHTFQKITIRLDEVEHYDEIYKNSERKECPICHKPLSKQYWRRHLKIHTEEKDYFCVVCGKGFGRKDHRDMHERKHINLIGNVNNA